MQFFKSRQYAVVPDSEINHELKNPGTLRDKRWPGCTVYLSLIFNFVLMIYVSLGRFGILPNTGFELTKQYSPAQSATLSHVPVLFEAGSQLNSTPYSGYPTPENNALWEELFDFGFSRITADEARPMPNKTLPIPGDEDHYMVSLSVFHDLHCLNRLRLAIYGPVDWTGHSISIGINHIDHCINAIRQTLMCHSDVTPLVWSRDWKDGKGKENMHVVHMCRNFDEVRQWSLNRRMKGEMDFYTVVENDPLGWGDFHA